MAPHWCFQGRFVCSSSTGTRLVNTREAARWPPHQSVPGQIDRGQIVRGQIAEVRSTEVREFADGSPSGAEHPGGHQLV